MRGGGAKPWFNGREDPRLGWILRLPAEAGILMAKLDREQRDALAVGRDEQHAPARTSAAQRVEQPRQQP